MDWSWLFLFVTIVGRALHLQRLPAAACEQPARRAQFLRGLAHQRAGGAPLRVAARRDALLCLDGRARRLAGLAGARHHLRLLGGAARNGAGGAALRARDRGRAAAGPRRGLSRGSRIGRGEAARRLRAARSPRESVPFPAPGSARRPRHPLRGRRGQATPARRLHTARRHEWRARPAADPRRWLDDRSQAPAGAAVAQSSRGARLGVCRSELSALAASDVPRAHHRREARDPLDPRTHRRVRRRRALPGGDRRLGRRAPHGAGRSHRERPGVPARFRGRRHPRTGRRALLRCLRLHRSAAARPAARLRALPRADGDQEEVRRRIATPSSARRR